MDLRNAQRVRAVIEDYPAVSEIYQVEHHVVGEKNATTHVAVALSIDSAT